MDKNSGFSIPRVVPNFVFDTAGVRIELSPKMAYCLALFASGENWASRKKKCVLLYVELARPVTHKSADLTVPTATYTNSLHVYGRGEQDDRLEIVLSKDARSFVDRIALLAELNSYLFSNVSEMLRVPYSIYHAGDGTVPGELHFSTKVIFGDIRDRYTLIDDGSYLYHGDPEHFDKPSIVSAGIFFGNQSVPRPEECDDIALPTWHSRGPTEHWVVLDDYQPSDF